MTPSLTGYFHGLRRLWWIPVLTVLVGLGMGIVAAITALPTAETRGNVLFTFQIHDPGQDSAGAARGAEAEIAQARLDGYVQLATASPAVRKILAASGVEQPPTTYSPNGTFKDATARVLIGAPLGSSGLVDVRVRNKELSPSEADQVVTALASEVARQVLATDAQQVWPSLRPDPLITRPQAVDVPVSRMTRLALPFLLLTTLGLGLVYLIVWRQGRIYSRREIEKRLGARVLGDFTGRGADAPAIALALGKGRIAVTTALLVPASQSPTEGAAWVGASVANGGREMGLAITLLSVDDSRSSRVSSSHAGAAAGTAPPDEPVSTSLSLIDSPAGLNANSLRAATSVDIVALIVEYGKTTYRELTSAGQTLAEVTDAEIGVVGVSAGARP